MPKREVKIKGNTFKYVYYKTSNYEPDETGYCAFVPLLKGCDTQAETLPLLDKNIKLAIKDWLDCQIGAVKEKHLENMKARCEISGASFFYEMAKNTPPEHIEKGFNSWYRKSLNDDTAFNNNQYIANLAWHAGFQYAVNPLSKADTLYIYDKENGHIMDTPLQNNTTKTLFITTEEVAKQLCMTPYTVRKYIRMGILQAIRIGKQYLIQQEDVNHLLEKIKKQNNQQEEKS